MEINLFVSLRSFSRLTTLIGVKRQQIDVCRVLFELHLNPLVYGFCGLKLLSQPHIHNSISVRNDAAGVKKNGLCSILLAQLKINGRSECTKS